MAFTLPPKLCPPPEVPLAGSPNFDLPSRGRLIRAPVSGAASGPRAYSTGPNTSLLLRYFIASTTPKIPVSVAPRASAASTSFTHSR